jgi:hypothetical protein
MRIRDTGTINANSDGTRRAIRFIPRIYSSIYHSPTYTAGTPTTFPLTSWGSAASWAFYTFNAAYLERYRINSFGVRIFTTSSTQTNSGLLTLATTASDTVTSGYSPVGDQLSKLEISCGGQLDVSWTSKPIDNSAHEFVHFNASAQEDTFDWEGLLVFCVGTTSDTVLQYEAVMDIEVLPIPDTIASRYTVDPVPNNSALANKLDNFYNGLSGFATGVNRAASVVGQVANAASAAGMAAAQLGYIANRYNAPQIAYY